MFVEALDIDGLAQDNDSSIMNALEIPHSWTKHFQMHFLEWKCLNCS